MTALVAALSLQDKIEQYGAYAGIAAVFGLGVLSLLYFAQAREVKRLRDWAGRAPERAAELEARVQADAQRRAAAAQQPRPTAPATPAAQQGATAAAAGAAAPATAAAAGGGTTTVAKPATATQQNGTGSSTAVPPPGAQPAQPEAKPGEGDKPAEGDGDGKPAEAKPDEGEPAAAPGEPAATPAGRAAAKPGAPAAPYGPAPSGPGRAAAPAQAAPTGAPAAPGKATPSGAPGQAAPPAPAAAPGKRAAPEPAIPAATAAAAARPAAPLRAPAASASVPPRTPIAERIGTGGGASRGRIAAIVGGVVALAAIVGVAVVLLTNGGDNKTPPAPNTVAQPGATSTPGSKPAPSRPARLDRKSFPLAVLNGTTVTGLARGAADKLTARGYNEPNVVTNDTTNQARATTEIFFEPKARSAALDVAKILGVKAGNVKPMDANARALADRATVAVFVGADKAQ